MFAAAIMITTINVFITYYPKFNRGPIIKIVRRLKSVDPKFGWIYFISSQPDPPGHWQTKYVGKADFSQLYGLQFRALWLMHSDRS